MSRRHDKASDLKKKPSAAETDAAPLDAQQTFGEEVREIAPLPGFRAAYVVGKGEMTVERLERIVKEIQEMGVLILEPYEGKQSAAKIERLMRRAVKTTVREFQRWSEVERKLFEENLGSFSGLLAQALVTGDYPRRRKLDRKPSVAQVDEESDKSVYLMRTDAYLPKLVESIKSSSSPAEVYEQADELGAKEVHIRQQDVGGEAGVLRDAVAKILKGTATPPRNELVKPTKALARLRKMQRYPHSWEALSPEFIARLSQLSTKDFAEWEDWIARSLGCMTREISVSTE